MRQIFKHEMLVDQSMANLVVKILGAIDFRFSYFLTAIGHYGGRGSYP